MRFLKIGLFILVLLAVLMVAGALILPTVIKQQIESHGSQAVGATVDLGNVSLHYWPVGVTLKHLQITDPENLNNNLLEWQTAKFIVNVSPLFSNKIHVQSLGIQGLVFDSNREKAGKLVDKKVSEGVQFDYEFPDVNEIIANENLETDKQYKALQESVESKQLAWGAMKDKLPDSKKLSAYKKELKAITDKPINNHQDLVEIQKSVNTFKQSIQQDRQRIKEAVSQLKDDKNELITSIMLLKAAPAKDYENLIKKYGVHQQGLVNMSQLLFGEQVGEWVNRLANHYEKLKPLFESDESTSDESKEGVDKAASEPWKVEITEGFIDMPQGQSSLQVDLTDLNWPVEKPGHITIKGSLYGMADELNADITLEGTEPLMAQTQFRLKQLPANQLISAMNLEKGRLDAVGQVGLIDDQLNGASEWQLKEMVLNEKGVHPLVAKALQDIHQVKAEVTVQGTISSPKIEYHSNLDESLKTAIQRAVKSKKAEFQAELTGKLNDKVSDYLGSLEKETNLLDAEITSLTQLNGQYSDLLNKKVETSKNKAQEKIKNELDKQFNKALNRWKP